MFKQHSEFQQPENSAILWRYVDLARYLDLLLKKQLFFSRADKFEDPFEGKYNKPGTDESLKNNIEQMPEESRTNENIQKAKQEINKAKEQLDEKRTEITVSSWHFNDHESYAMWKIYARGSYGIALQTTYERLKSCFDVTDKPIFIGKVNYYDEKCDPIPVNKNSFIPFLQKRRIYEYESEVRCCYALSQQKDKEIEWQQQDIYHGVFIPVDLDKMIERVYISPYSPKWIRDIVAGINEKFDLKKEIVHSGVFDSVDY